jgi:hypothetical protein
MNSNYLFQTGTESELVPLNIIRSETVLSRLPIHNLSKQGRINIEIKKRNEHGAVELLWEVSYNERYGQPRQLAYKLDTIVINRRIEEAGRPLPKAVRVGSLREICKELDLSEGESTNQIKRAIHQNAGTYITAKLNYVGNDGVERKLEAGFTRYSVVFTGEKLPDGRRADAVYLILNEPYREVLNNAPIRPLDYDYLKALTPAAQRCYEIISYRIFAAIKFKLPHAKLAYSEYCTFSAQRRYYDFDHVKKQMYKVHRQHLQSHYLAKVWLEAATDDEGNADWVMHYIPGAKARAEYATFTRKGQLVELKPDDAITKSSEQSLGSARPKKKIKSSAPKQEVDESVLRELVRRGITEARARKLLAGLPTDHFILDQLEWGDALIRKASPGTYRNPPGFYIYLIESNVLVPENFETRRRKQLRLAAEEKDICASAQLADRELACAEYMRATVDRYLNESMNEAERQQFYEAKRRDLVKKHSSISSWPEEQVSDVIHSAVQAEIMLKVELMNFKEFCEEKR